MTPSIDVQGTAISSCPDPRKGMRPMATFYGIDCATAEFLFGPRVDEFQSVTYEGRTTKGAPPYSGSFEHVDTYRITRHGEIRSVAIPDGDGYRDYMSEGTAFDVVITDHGVGHSRRDHRRRYMVQVVRREVEVRELDDRKVVVTANFDVEDHSPATVHRKAMRLVVDLFPPRRTDAPSGVLVTS